ncbi:MAG TPA: phosphoglycerate kinase, partial [Anaerovoracaceae bacterium]|nr:phosphoglycerate kinase [Anaerovoracaceae bacterium]
MEVGSRVNIRHMDEFDYEGKTVLLRVDINSPIDRKTKKIVNENRIKKSIPTIESLLEKGAKLAIIAHQGDTLDYENLISMEEHTEKLSFYLGRKVRYVDDVAGPAAQQAVKDLQPGEAVLLGNVRYLTEEVSTFENAVKLKPEEMTQTYIVRNLAPLMDYYINDAFAAAHRNSPSMVAFQQVLPYAGGLLLMEEVGSLAKVLKSPAKPCVFVLGGAKISDAFGMMEQVLALGTADKILTCGITGEIMLLAQGISLGKKKEDFIRERGLDIFIKDAQKYLAEYGGRLCWPKDLAYEENGVRKEIPVASLPAEEMFMDVGEETIAEYEGILASAETIFVNGPAGAYENPLFEKAT